jgi:hypothetical protein
MIAFEITINGQKITTAGVESEFGMLTALLTWTRRDIRELPAEIRSEVPEEDLKIVLSGQRIIAKNDMENLQWKGHTLKPGDDVRIKIVDVERVDDPQRVKKIHSEFVEKKSSEMTLH